MKKLVLVIAVLFFAAGFQAKAVKPIPSYHSPMYGLANFQEKHIPLKNGPKEKRDMNVQSTVSGGGPKLAIVYVYSLDMATILGPFYLYGDDKITVQVDEREWGVFVLTDEQHMTVSVWSDKTGSGGTKLGENLFKPVDKNINTGIFSAQDVFMTGLRPEPVTI
jgi:hypothetical protein